MFCHFFVICCIICLSCFRHFLSLFLSLVEGSCPSNEEEDSAMQPETYAQSLTTFLNYLKAKNMFQVTNNDLHPVILAKAKALSTCDLGLEAAQSVP